MKTLVAAAALLAAAPVAAGAPGRGAPVEIKIEVTEVDQNKALRLGLEWPASTHFSESAGSVLGVGRIDRMPQLQADLHHLVEEGAAEMLANPNLVTDSGTPASFHAGGQIPYITSSGLGTTHVQFKPYGVIVSIDPEAMADGRIRMKVKASISSPDPANGASFNGTVVPALREREVSSNVTLQGGGTLMLAGLVQTEKNRVESGVPVLRRIPLLGALFRWRRNEERKSTIIVFVTPRLVSL
ncbi:MAG: type II and III secretion system protein [Elusimicrobia bacterium]|nr:type II and III secretion system protein [Elusimicrobiota bacterium]